MKIAVAAKTDPGRLYEHNEDHFVLLRKAGLFLVADGVGGEEAGEVASKLACRIIQQSLSESLPTTDKTRHDAALVKAIQAANHGLHEYAATRPGKAGVGTTLVALWFHGDRTLFAYVGDSRIYLYRNGVLRQLSRDEKAGRYRLAASLGQAGAVEPRLGMVRLRRGDRFLLCTDGLYGPVPHADLTALLDSEPDPEACCGRLIAAANAAGGPDNITALVADVIEPDRPHRWRFSKVWLDATSPATRLRRAPLWAAVALCAIAATALIAWAASQTSWHQGPPSDVHPRLAVLVVEANDGAEAGDQQATLRALRAMVRAAVEERLLVKTAGLGLHETAVPLYDQAAQAVWDKLSEPVRSRIGQLTASPGRRYVEDDLHAAIKRLEQLRKQFMTGDFRAVADTLSALEKDLDDMILRTHSDLARDKAQLGKDLETLRLDATEFEPDSAIRRELEAHLDAARRALDAEDIPTAFSEVAAARAIFQRGSTPQDD